MSTYYRNAKGRVVTNSPWKYVEYWRRTHRPAIDDFAIIPAAQLPAMRENLQTLS